MNERRRRDITGEERATEREGAEENRVVPETGWWDGRREVLLGLSKVMRSVVIGPLAPPQSPVQDERRPVPLTDWLVRVFGGLMEPFVSSRLGYKNAFADLNMNYQHVLSCSAVNL